MEKGETAEQRSSMLARQHNGNGRFQGVHVERIARSNEFHKPLAAVVVSENRICDEVAALRSLLMAKRSVETVFQSSPASSWPVMFWRYGHLSVEGAAWKKNRETDAHETRALLGADEAIAAKTRKNG
jgi:hypothetical protein